MSETAGLRDEPFEADVTASELVYAGRVWDVRSDTVRYGDGEIVRQYVDHPGAAAVVAVDDEERVLLIQQYRHPIGTYEWELPAGLLDVPEEPPVECARRELLEEADLRARTWEPLGHHHSSPGGSSEVLHVYLARGLSEVPAAERHERDGEEAGMPTRWVPLEDVVDAIMAGAIHNGTLIVGILMAAEQRRRG